MKSKNTVISLELSKELLAQIKQEAEKLELSQSAFIRLALQAYLDQKNGKRQTTIKGKVNEHRVFYR